MVTDRNRKSRNLRILCPFEIILTQKENEKGRVGKRREEQEKKLGVSGRGYLGGLIASVDPCS